MGLLDDARQFFTREAGQERRKWLDENLQEAGGLLNYYLGPTGVPDKLQAAGGLLNYTDAGDMTEAADASREFWNDPSFRGGVRLGTAGAAMAIPFVGARMLNDGVDVVGDALRSGGDDVSRFAADESGAVGITRTGGDVMVDVTVNNEGNGLYSVFADGAPAGEVRIARNGAGDFVERSQLNPEFQGKRIGHQAYNLIERDMGKRLVPSPTGLSANGAAFWRRRIKDYEPDEAVDAYKRSQAAGRGYGIPDRDINMRLYGVGGSDALDAISPTPSPAQQQAQDVLGLLQSGRGADVTDDMLAAADDMYLFDNYDLPLDEASRMARAQDMGFGDDQYHATMSDFVGFEPSQTGLSGRGVYTGDDARDISDYATASHDSTDGLNIMPLRVPGADQYAGKIDWQNVIDADSGFPHNATLDETIDGFRRAADSMGGDGFAGVMSQPGERVTFDPANIRSRFARFDPRLSHLRNLSAGIGGIGLLYGMPQRNDREGF